MEEMKGEIRGGAAAAAAWEWWRGSRDVCLQMCRANEARTAARQRGVGVWARYLELAEVVGGQRVIQVGLPARSSA